MRGKDVMQDEYLKTCPTCKLPKDTRTEYYKDSKTGKDLRTCSACFNALRATRHASKPAQRMLTAARTRAKHQGVPCTITADDIIIPDTCPILGIPLMVKTGSKGGSPNSPSLDKIIPALGYIPGNVLVISTKANLMKQDASLEDLVMLGKWAARMLVKQARQKRTVYRVQKPSTLGTMYLSENESAQTIQ